VKARPWRAFAAPAAFLLAVTIAVALVRPVLHGESTVPAKPKATSAAKAQLPPKRASARVYTVRAGDTLASIASRTGISLTRLLALNPEVRPTSLFIGQRIHLR
jgi:LysM repeat protein